MSTMLPGLTRWAGFSTRRWKIHGWLERQALRRRMVGRGSVMDASLRGRLAPTPTLPRRRGREHGRTRYQCDRHPSPRRRGREHGRMHYQCAGTPSPAGGGREHGRTRYEGERSEEHTSELQSRENLVCRLLVEKKTACAT